MLRAVVLLPFLGLIGCGHYIGSGLGASQSVVWFTAADAPPVDSGRYSGRLRFLSLDDPLAARSAPLRADAESHEQILRRLVREHIAVKSPLEFRFMYVGHDSASNRLVLRYFARAADQREFAGWQVQLVYLVPSLRLERAYVQAVPLE